MNCNWFDKYDRGKIKDEPFQKHVQECPFCKEKVQQSEKFLGLSKSLKKRVEAPFLWTRIEQELRELQSQSKKEGHEDGGKYWHSWIKYPVSAVLLVVFCAGMFLWLRPGLQDSTLLADSALRRIVKREQRYERSIEKLQESVIPQLSDMGLELMFLYRDRMETIDEQILACKEALLENPGNTHIRKYMLAAFQDKKSTLIEIIDTSAEMYQRENLQ